MSSADSLPATSVRSEPWLSIVGIGEDGIEGLNPAARNSVTSAEIVFGGSRHLTLAAPLIRGIAHAWPTPFDPTLAQVLAHRDRAVCVLASGDPLAYGVGNLLARHVSPDQTRVFPVASAFSLAASRLLWPLAHTVLLSLCGRSLDFLRPHLHARARILVLTSDERVPVQLARMLSALGFGHSRMTVLEALGGPNERIRAVSAGAFHLEAIAPLNTVAIEVSAVHGARVLARAPGLDDDWFEHDGQITKRDIRALTLSALAPRRGERLWDVGAGSGSVAIEWLLADSSLSATAIERRGDRVARIRRNAASFGVPHLHIVEGGAPAALGRLATPDAVFIGGGLTIPGSIDVAQDALRSGGRLVANAVTLAAESVLLDYQSRTGGSLTRIALSRASPIGTATGRLSGWRPAMPITQWAWVKP